MASSALRPFHGSMPAWAVLSGELDPHRVHRRHPDVEDGSNRPRVPVQAGVEIIEEAVTRHVDLGAFGLFRGTTVDPQGPRNALSFHQALRRDRRSAQGRTQEIVAAAVAAGLAIGTRLWPRHGRVAQAGQRVVLRQEADLRPVRALAPFSDKCGRHARRARAGDGESRRLQFAGVDLGRRHLLQADLGQLPDLSRNSLDGRFAAAIAVSTPSYDSLAIRDPFGMPVINHGGRNDRARMP